MGLPTDIDITNKPRSCRTATTAIVLVEYSSARMVYDAVKRRVPTKMKMAGSARRPPWIFGA